MILFILIALIIFLKIRQKYFFHNYENGRERITGWMPPAPGKKWDIYDMHIAENYKKEMDKRVKNGEDTSDIW